MNDYIVLNSGGFDSTVLLHDIADQRPKAKGYSVFFDYGQNSVEQERRCARKNAEKLGLEHIEITIPKISWSQTNFYGAEFQDSQSQYLELRNLIFLSYVLSFAESRGVTDIFMAIILADDFWYNDTDPRFFEDLNNLALNTIGAWVYTPYTKFLKDDLVPLVFKYGISPDDYYSCDNPNPDGSMCGKCGDCKFLIEIAEMIKNQL